MRLPNCGDYLYHRLTALEQENASLRRKLEAAENGSGAAALREKFASMTSGLERKLHAEKSGRLKDKARHQREMAEQRKALTEISELSAAYADQQIAKARKREAQAWDQAARTEALYEKALETIREQKAKIEDLEGQLACQKRLLNQNHENSSIPSSGEGVRKRKIQSSRTPSGRKPGAQPNHAPHKRPQLERAEEAVVAAGPSEIVQSSDWEQVDARTKLVADLHAAIRVTPYVFPIYRNKHTGKIYRVPVPAELHDDLNYGPGLKAALFLAHTEFNMPARSVAELFRDISGGSISVSHGFIAGLTKEFALKSEQEYRQIARDLLQGPYIHIDTTTAQCEAGRHHVTTNVNERSVFLCATKHKGKEAAEQTPYAAGFKGCGIHDGEPTFDNYGEAHQQCHAHLLRRLQDVIENEPDKQWAKDMHKLLQSLAHDRKSWSEDGPSPAYKRSVRWKYTRYVNNGLAEYKRKDASKYYREGKNLLAFFKNNRDAILYFLDHPEIPQTNNAAERALRPVKRKQAAGMCWRSAESLRDYCKAKSVLSTERKQCRSCYEKTVEVMTRPKSFPES